MDVTGIDALEALSRRLGHTSTIARLCADASAVGDDATKALNGIADAIEEHEERLDLIIKAERRATV